MMPTNLTLLERKISNNLNCLYFVDHPVFVSKRTISWFSHLNMRALVA